MLFILKTHGKKSKCQENLNSINYLPQKLMDKIYANLKLLWLIQQKNWVMLQNVMILLNLRLIQPHIQLKISNRDYIEESYLQLKIKKLMESKLSLKYNFPLGVKKCKKDMLKLEKNSLSVINLQLLILLYVHLLWVLAIINNSQCKKNCKQFWLNILNQKLISKTCKMNSKIIFHQDLNIPSDFEI